MADEIAVKYIFEAASQAVARRLEAEQRAKQLLADASANKNDVVNAIAERLCAMHSADRYAAYTEAYWLREETSDILTKAYYKSTTKRLRPMISSKEHLCGCGGPIEFFSWSELRKHETGRASYLKTCLRCSKLDKEKRVERSRSNRDKLEQRTRIIQEAERDTHADCPDLLLDWYMELESDDYCRTTHWRRLSGMFLGAFGGECLACRIKIDSRDVEEFNFVRVLNTAVRGKERLSDLLFDCGSCRQFVDSQGNVTPNHQWVEPEYAPTVVRSP